jgi:protein SCO1
VKRLRCMLLAGCVALFASGAPIDTARSAGAASSRIAALPAAAAERTFSLVDQHGRSVSAADFHGRWLVVYFGFTQCPDVCPATLALLAAALRTLGADAGALQAVFITIDPEHDTGQVLASYLQNFGPNFIGLTGSAAQIAAAAQSFGAYSGGEKGASAAMSLAHSSTLYVVDPQGRLNRQLSSQMTAAQLATYLRKALKSELLTGSALHEGSLRDD